MSAAGSEVGGNRTQELARAPPSASCMDLRSWVALTGYSFITEGALTDKDLSKHVEDYAGAKTPLIDLLASCKSAVAEAQAAIKDVGEHDTPAKGKGKSKGKDKPCSVLSLLFPDVGTAIPSFDPAEHCFHPSRPHTMVLAGDVLAQVLNE